ncbi:MAG: NYN domain-containing protein [Lachnospiraceae bacterium]|nr:NYN domain-containing protein [Lachnospiraceae bacterium]
MLRGMVFIDHMNFDIALQKYYKSLSKPTIKLDYNKLFKNVCAQIDNVDFLKGFIFVPKPDEFLMKDKSLELYYNWVTGMKNAPYTDVIEGRYVSRQVDDSVPMEIDKKSTYYKVEKGTDINLAVHAISKAFYNSYDIAFFLSADTDYIKVYEVLKSIGKITVVVGVKGQNINGIRPMVDNTLVLDENFFKTCEREKTSKNLK